MAVVDNTTSLAVTKPPCLDGQTPPKSNSSMETPNLTNEVTQRTSEVNIKNEISSQLNPMAAEFLPSLRARTHSEILRVK